MSANTTFYEFPSTVVTDGGETMSTCKGTKQFNMGLIIIVGALVGLVALLTIAGNTLVIVAFGVDRKLRSFGNYFIINLAISDLIVGILVAPRLRRSTSVGLEHGTHQS